MSNIEQTIIELKLGVLELASSLEAYRKRVKQPVLMKISNGI